MNRIRLLPEQVANQIAAGEVVERPASVVKELVENAFDAQARSLTVEIQAGGRSLIRVTDDGVGMSKDDALLCLERHATSKIESVHDLARIGTMGFRGEALPSIASVSRMTITSREREGDAEGVQVVIHGGKILEVKAAGCAPGTSMEVRNLFFNVPARRKFLRSEETERIHIQHYLMLAALACPETGLTFLQDGRLIWQLPPAQSTSSARHGPVQERLRSLYGSDLKWVPVDFTERMDSSGEDRELTFRLWGFIGAPGVSRTTREDQHLFVNRRPVENRGLNFALLEGYHTSLMKGRFPVCCLFLELDPGEVDVNIHPAKREVKFRQEQTIKNMVSDAIRQALLRYHGDFAAPPEAASPRPAVKTTPTPHPELGAVLQTEASSVSPRSVAAGFSSFLKKEAENAAPAVEPLRPVPSSEPAAAPAPPARAEPSPVGSPSTPSEPVPLLNVPLRILGVIGKLYVLMESDRGLVLMDQHAAHERILFEQMLHQLESEEAPSQRLLLPETLELSVRDAQFVRENLGTFGKLGVGLSEFGERTFLLDSLPPFVTAPDARRFVIEIIDELKASGDNVNSWRLGEHTVAKTVCRHAVKAHDPLQGPELEKLLADLRLCDMPYTCPHGRPTLIEMSYRELEKKFGRTQ